MSESRCGGGEMKVLLVGGTWDLESGHPSGLVRKIGEALGKFVDITVQNGGLWTDISPLAFTTVQYDAVLWWPDVPNELPKDLKIKKIASHTILCSSKNNLSEKYSLQEIVARALDAHANLMVIYTGLRAPYKMQLLDPLGNAYCPPTEDPEVLAKALADRLLFLKSLTRVPSTSSGNCSRPPVSDPMFFDWVHFYADKFHQLLDPGPDVKRLLGNASFRCSYGFPALRDSSNGIYVSKRNVDKRDITPGSFVRVWMENGILMYDRDEKPSVDAPVQVRLFEAFPNINYMIHGHVYLVGGKSTSLVLPCGALEEVDEIVEICQPDTRFETLNLRGHGCLVMASELWQLKGQSFFARPKPEEQYSNER
jgi:hypothetical protein